MSQTHESIMERYHHTKKNYGRNKTTAVGFNKKKSLWDTICF